MPAALTGVVAPATPLQPQAQRCCLCPMGPGCPAGTSAAFGAPHHELPPFAHRVVLSGELLYREGDRFRHLHALRGGTFKSCVSLPDGREQVSGFHMAGDLVGLDGLADGRHQATVIALEDTPACAINYPALLDLAADVPLLQHALHRLMSREIARGRWHLLLLGRMTAQERLAAFLIDLSERALARGRSARDLDLRMTRREIGSYLGLTLETVSRSLAGLKEMKHLEVDNRQVRIRDLPRFLRLFQNRPEWPEGLRPAAVVVPIRSRAPRVRQRTENALLSRAPSSPS